MTTMKTKAERDYIIDLMTVASLLNKVLNTLEADSDEHGDDQFEGLLDSVLTALTKCENLLKERL